MSTLPLEDEITEALYRDLWVLRQAMGPAPMGDATDYLPPAHRYLPALKEGAELWAAALAQAKVEIPAGVTWDITQASFAGVNPVQEVARLAPEVRRYWLVRSLCHLLDAGIEILEQEGRPVPPPRPLPKLSKVRPWSGGVGNSKEPYER